MTKEQLNRMDYILDRLETIRNDAIRATENINNQNYGLAKDELNNIFDNADKLHSTIVRIWLINDKDKPKGALNEV